MTEPLKKTKVIVVDDSPVVRGLFSGLLDVEKDIDVVATAENGTSIINLLKREGEGAVDVDIITLDIEMGEDKDGLDVLPEILELRPNVKVIMASSLTQKGANAAIKAISRGAADALGKPSSSGGDREAMYKFAEQLVEKVRQLGSLTQLEEKRHDSIQVTSSPTATPSSLTAQKQAVPSRGDNNFQLHPPMILPKINVLAIGSSTGGPKALGDFFTKLQGQPIRVPIFITQHMPPEFTTALAKQISQHSGMDCHEAEDGEEVKPGVIYLAPGDYHLLVKRDGIAVRCVLDKGASENFCRPAVDPMVRSLQEVYGRNMLLTILTGMGYDGLLAAKQLVEAKGVVLAQDEESSVVWGMPGAVAKAGICHDVLPLNELPDKVMKLLIGGL